MPQSASRPQSAATPGEGEAPPRRFWVHAAHDGARREHTVEGASFEEAAIAFVEIWHPALDAEGDVSVIVRDAESGQEHCFLIDVDRGQAGPCE